MSEREVADITEHKALQVNQLSIPSWFREYLDYIIVIRNLSPRTVTTYYLSLQTFFRWVLIRPDMTTQDEMQNIDISLMPFSAVEEVANTDIYSFLSFEAQTMGNAASSRSMKLSALKSFFEYYSLIQKRLSANPCEGISSPKIEKHLPKYLSESECIRLLDAILTTRSERDYCMVTLLINCGMRLSELVGINVKDIRKIEDNTGKQVTALTLFGKGRKERVIYLNKACEDAVRDCIEERKKYAGDEKTPALFVSRIGRRISTRRVQQIVERGLLKAGLSGRGFSPHKLRHTAATLIYRSGKTDILTLKEILGHENIATTEIYTHLQEGQVRQAMMNSPLSHVSKHKFTTEKE